MAAMAADTAFRKDASSEAKLLEALAPRIDRSLFDGPQPGETEAPQAEQMGLGF